jgi:hypothetical protein
MNLLRHDAFIAQLQSLKSQYQEFDGLLNSLIREVENLKNQAIQSKLNEMKRDKGDKSESGQ